jgi:hypothetical protein
VTLNGRPNGFVKPAITVRTIAKDGSNCDTSVRRQHAVAAIKAQEDKIRSLALEAITAVPVHQKTMGAVSMNILKGKVKIQSAPSKDERRLIRLSVRALRTTSAYRFVEWRQGTRGSAW